MPFQLYRLMTNSYEFPPIHLAATEPNGLLAVGGDLSPGRLIQAYSQGIFPWFSKGDPLLWWSPTPRAVITGQSLHVSRSLKKTINTKDYCVAFNTNFAAVIHACAAPRVESPGTWILPEMIQAYLKLHQLGIAHSIEIYQAQELIGGLYGLSLGPFFFGESMFSFKPNASKLAIVHLIEKLKPLGLEFLDCQMMTPHLQSMGAIDLPRDLMQQKLVYQLGQLNLEPLQDIGNSLATESIVQRALQ